jgi:hypothetical protein
MVTLLAWLAETIGLKGMAKGLVKWGLRIALLALLLALVRVVWVNPGLRQYAIGIAVLGLVWAVFQWSRRFRRPMKWGLRLLAVVAACWLTSQLHARPFSALSAADLVQVLTTAMVAISLVWDGFQWWRIRKSEAHAGRAIARLVTAIAGALALLFLVGQTDMGLPVLMLIAALGLLFWGAFQWWRGRNDEADAGERSIDGKVVPDKLAVAALAIPASSPDGDYVLRGLPDFGKALLKLNSNDFEYVPDVAEPEPEPVAQSPLNERAVKPSSRAIPRWVKATAGAAALLFAAGLVFVGRNWFYEIQHRRQPKEAWANVDADYSKTGGADVTHRKAAGRSHLQKALALAGTGAEYGGEIREAINAYEAAADPPGKDAEAEYILAELYLDNYPGLNSSNVAFSLEGKTYLEESAEQGFPPAELLMAKSYEAPYDGYKGFTRSAQDAVKWYEKVMVDAKEGSDEYIQAERALNRLKLSRQVPANPALPKEPTVQ